MDRPCAARIVGLAVAALLALSPALPSASAAQTTAETEITVTTENAGSFAIGFAPLAGGYTFVNGANGTTFEVSALSGDTATMTVLLAWTDNRADGQRTGYQIALSADDLTSTVPRPDNQEVYTIAAAHLWIVGIRLDPFAVPVSLEAPRTVIATGGEPAAGELAVEIGLRLDIPPSSYPTTYTTTLHVQVDFGSGGP